jgi:hypothetical protein
MEVGSGYVVPGEAGCGACFETWSVVYELRYNHFQNLLGKSVRLSIHCSTRAARNPECEHIVDCGFGPVPNDVGDGLGFYDMLCNNGTRESR